MNTYTSFECNFWCIVCTVLGFYMGWAWKGILGSGRNTEGKS